MTISDIVTARLENGEPQQIHIPWPTALGTYATNQSTDADMDRWVSDNISVPDAAALVGICAGRAYYRHTLTPCIVVTCVPRRTLEKFGGLIAHIGMRKTWADGRGGVR